MINGIKPVVSNTTKTEKTTTKETKLSMWWYGKW